MGFCFPHGILQESPRCLSLRGWWRGFIWKTQGECCQPIMNQGLLCMKTWFRIGVHHYVLQLYYIDILHILIMICNLFCVTGIHEHTVRRAVFWIVYYFLLYCLTGDRECHTLIFNWDCICYFIKSTNYILSIRFCQQITIWECGSVAKVIGQISHMSKSTLLDNSAGGICIDESSLWAWCHGSARILLHIITADTAAHYWASRIEWVYS